MNNRYVHHNRDGNIARITLARAERHNALVPALLDDLLQALAFYNRHTPRAIILDAQGTSFSSGGDVQAFFEMPREERSNYASEVVGKLNRVILAMLESPTPIVAAIQGMVTGGSLGLVLASDIVVASDNATFAPWYTVVGFSPDGGWSNLMGQRIGPSRALEIQLTNRTLSASQALDYGLVHYRVKPDALEPQVQSLCQSLCQKQPRSVRRTLRLNRPDPDQIASLLQQEYEQFLAQIVTDEAHVGMAKFLKRTP